MIKMNFRRAAICAAFAALAATSPARAYTGEALASQAKVTIEAARAIALKASPGRIKDEELEREEGGSGLRYTFVIDAKNEVREVGVDAATGAVLENAVE